MTLRRPAEKACSHTLFSEAKHCLALPWHHRLTRPIYRYSSVVTVEKAIYGVWKFIENCNNGNFNAVVIRKTNKEIYISVKIWELVALYQMILLLKPFRQCHSWTGKRFLRRDCSDESRRFTHEHSEFDWLLYQVLAKFPRRGVCNKRRLAFLSERTKKKGELIGVPWIQAKWML